MIATARGANADDIYKELVSNLIRNSHMAPAGIVAVNRAQERGYALAVGGSSRESGRQISEDRPLAANLSSTDLIWPQTTPLTLPLT